MAKSECLNPKTNLATGYKFLYQVNGVWIQKRHPKVPYMKGGMLSERRKNALMRFYVPAASVLLPRFFDPNLT
ncbi:hypothetical protein GCM10027343_42820 [Noviherbaspirillum agri]